MPAPWARLSKTETNKPYARLKWMLGAALLALLGGGGALVGSGGTAAVAEALENPLSLFAERSPGSRPEGALLATKRAKAKAEPVEMVLSQERVRPPLEPEDAAPETSLAAPALYPLAPELLDPLLPDTGPEQALMGLPGGPIFGGGSPGGLIPIGDLPSGSPGSPGCCTPGTPTTPTDPVIPAVPEPTTWAMMILGFFMVGGSLRASAKRRAGLRAA
jgi:hypothetical protein